MIIAYHCGVVAQLVEHRTFNPGVGSSNLLDFTKGLTPKKFKAKNQKKSNTANSRNADMI